MTAAPGPQGIDVSAWNTDLDWPSLYGSGTRFAYVKATEGNYYVSKSFDSQYIDSRNAGLIRGAYHFANPSMSSGKDQADYFVNNGGGWTRDGWTLPGVLDIEYNPYKGNTCYDLTPVQMTDWIASFTKRYKALTGRDAVIYTTYDWWQQCTGDTTAFNQTNPLWIAYYGPTPGRLPGNWGFHTFWQYSSTPIDQDWFNGSYVRLQKLAAPDPAVAPVCSAKPFPDVPTTSPFCGEITWMKGQGMAAGYANGKFRPTTAVSRQAFAHYMYERYAAVGRHDGPCTTGSSGFSDVPATSQFCRSIRTLSRAGVTTGYPDGGFHPKAPISRQAIAAMVYRDYNVAVVGRAGSTNAACTSPTPFNDVDRTNQFCGEIEFMHDRGLSVGYKDGGYHPASKTSRQAIAAFLYQYDQQVS